MIDAPVLPPSNDCRRGRSRVFDRPAAAFCGVLFVLQLAFAVGWLGSRLAPHYYECAKPKAPSNEVEIILAGDEIQLSTPALKKKDAQ